MFFKKWPPLAILDVQKSLCIAFLTISDQYHNFYFCEVFLQNGCPGHFGCPKITVGRIFGHFRLIRNFFLNFVYTMAAVGHFGCPKFTLDHISGYFRSWLSVAILNVRKSLSISFLIQIDLRSHSDRYTTLICFEFFDKMAAVGHFGCPKFTLDHISGHFRSMQIFFNFFFFLQNGCRWPFWMSENHFWSHFYPFHIDTQL